MYKEKIKVICAFCGKEEYVNPCRAKKYNCCSRECMGKYNSVKYNEKLNKVCPICGDIFLVKRSHFNKRVCCSLKCSNKYRSLYKTKEENSNYKLRIIELENGVCKKDYSRYKYPYHKIVLETLDIKKIPKGYDIHHKDGNHLNNNIENLILISRNTHMLLHRWFGNILLNAIETNKISRDLFYSLCSKEQEMLYKNIIDLDIIKQILVDENYKMDIIENPYKYIKNES